ncbi:hypothetical protein K1719_008894 [Acacia pycnantha]|nr:hypothetical protein K1719_008894 [Acacia pycnantha]
MRRRGRELLRLYSSLRCGTTKSSSSTFASRRLIIPFRSSFSSNPCGVDKRPPKSQRDSLLLEKFRLRKLKGPSSPQASKKVVERDLKNEDESSKGVTNFKELGLSERLNSRLQVLGYATFDEGPVDGTDELATLIPVIDFSLRHLTTRPSLLPLGLLYSVLTSPKQST